MSPSRFTVDTDALHAYVDGRLTEGQRATVERYLAEHPAAADEVAEWRRQNEALNALFPPLDDAVPPQLAAAAIARRQREERRSRMRNFAAAIALVLIGSGVGWFGRDALTPTEAASSRLIDAAVTAHTLYVKEKTHAVEVAAGSPNLMTWLSNRIATPIDAPSLMAQGFTFVGGRLLPSDPGDGLPSPAAQLMYENAAAQRVTLYITAALPDGHEVWNFETRGSVEAYYWANGTVTCTVVGDLPEADLRQVGKTVFEQLTWRPDPRSGGAG